MSLPSTSIALMCFCAWLAVLFLVPSTHAVSSCPEIESQLATCFYNRTELLSELYYKLAPPGDPTHCVSTSRLARAYEILLPIVHKSKYGYNFDDHIFSHCDWLLDDKCCPVDVHQTKCECVTRCDQLFVVYTMLQASITYPDWENTYTPWTVL